jgi:hypothetical protein
MTISVTAAATQTTQSSVQFSREAILGVLDRAPDGYKLLAKLVDDPCELVRASSPGDGRTQHAKLEGQLRSWLVCALQGQA